MSTSQQREFRADSVPQEHRNRVINQFHVEFLNYDRVISTGDPVRDALRQGKKKNHVIFRVVFAQPAPGGIQAARISMDVVLDDVGSTEAVYAGSNASDDPAVTDGAFNVKLVRYAGTSTSALSSFTFSVRNNTTLGQLLDVALSRQMHRFKFTVLYSLAYMGCRDFM